MRQSSSIHSSMCSAGASGACLDTRTPSFLCVANKKPHSWVHLGCAERLAHLVMACAAQLLPRSEIKRIVVDQSLDSMANPVDRRRLRNRIHRLLKHAAVFTMRGTLGKTSARHGQESHVPHCTTMFSVAVRDKFLVSAPEISVISATHLDTHLLCVAQEGSVAFLGDRASMGTDSLQISVIQTSGACVLPPHRNYCRLHNQCRQKRRSLQTELQRREFHVDEISHRIMHVISSTSMRLRQATGCSNVAVIPTQRGTKQCQTSVQREHMSNRQCGADVVPCFKTRHIGSEQPHAPDSARLASRPYSSA